LVALFSVGALLAGAITPPSNASTPTISWNHVNGQDACRAGTTGTMLVIFNPHSDAVPGDMTITWSTGETDIYPASGWINPGNGQNWHLTVTIVGQFPPQDMVLSYTGTLGDNPILTISGCNEGGTPVPPTPPGTTTGTTGTTTTTTGQTTTTSPTTTTGQTTTTGETTTTGTTITQTTTTGTTVTTTTTIPGGTVTGPTTTTPGGTVTGPTSSVPGNTTTGPSSTVPGSTVTGPTSTVPGGTVTGPTTTVKGKVVHGPPIIKRKVIVQHVKPKPGFSYTR
jgi:hypothetical protein